MARYYVTHQTLTYNCGMVEVKMTTHQFQHLWLLYTIHEPQVVPVPDAQQPGPRPHQNNLITYIDGVIEQEEPLDTKEHTFHFALPPQTTIVWFYTVNLGSALIKATRSPIFAYEFIPVPIWQETWEPPAVYDHGWQTVNNPPFSLAYPSLNRLRMFKSNIGVVPPQFATFSLGNGFGPVIDPFESCPTLLTFTIPADPTPAPEYPMNIYLRIAPYFRPGIPINLYIVASPSSGAIPDLPPPDNQMVISLPPGERTLSLSEVIRLRNLAYPTSMTVGNSSINQIVISTGQVDSSGFQAVTGDFGPLSLYQVNETPKDVSRFWRSKRLHPVLR